MLKLESMAAFIAVAGGSISGVARLRSNGLVGWLASKRLVTEADCVTGDLWYIAQFTGEYRGPQ